MPLSRCGPIFGMGQCPSISKIDGSHLNIKPPEALEGPSDMSSLRKSYDLGNRLAILFSELMLIWPIHPRTKKQLELFGLWDKIFSNENILILNPIGYHDMLKLNMNAKIMLTDSGGLQEECTVLGTPCITLRWNTERPITLREHGGASVLVGNDTEKIRSEFHKTLLKRN